MVKQIIFLLSTAFSLSVFGMASPCGVIEQGCRKNRSLKNIKVISSLPFVEIEKERALMNSIIKGYVLMNGMAQEQPFIKNLLSKL